MHVEDRATGRLTSAGRWLARIEDQVPGVLLAIMTVLIAVDVAMRYLVDDPIRGAAEVATALFVWAVLLAAAAAARRDLHVRVELFEGRGSPRRRLVLDCVARVLTIAIAATLAVFAVQYYLDARTAELPLLGISFGHVVISAPIGFALIAAHDVAHLVRDLRALRGSAEDQAGLLSSRATGPVL